MFPFQNKSTFFLPHKGMEEVETAAVVVRKAEMMVECPPSRSVVCRPPTMPFGVWVLWAAVPLVEMRMLF